MNNIKASYTLFAFIRNWRFRSQVLCAQTIFIIIVILIGTGYFIFAQSFLIQEISHQSFIILAQRILSKQSYIYSVLNKKQLQQGLMLTNTTLKVINSLFEQQQSTNIRFQYHINSCDEFESPSSFFSQFANSSCYCYGMPYNATEYSQHQDKMSLGNLLIQTALIQNKLYRTYFASNTKDQFYVFQPCKYYPSTYNPSFRPWYIYHNQSLNEVQNSQPYFAFSGGITLTKTLNLRGLNNEVKGVIGTDIIMKIFFPQDESYPYNFVLIDSDGHILLSNHYTINSTIVDLYYNQSVTGFDSQDFQTIMNFSKGLNYENYCEIPINQTLCLLDKTNNKDYYVKVQKLDQENYYLISKFDQAQYKSNVDMLIDEVNAQSQKIIQDFVLGILISLLLCGCCYLVTIFILEKPLYKLMNLSLRRNQMLSSIFQQIKLQHFTNDTIDKLADAFTGLINYDNRLKNTFNNSTKQELEEIFSYLPQNITVTRTLLLLIQEKLPDYKKQNKSLFYLNTLDNLKEIKEFLINERKILSI
ncbi:unnamed protein product (macronuclear) [Paramecium tetraurelia]|uniref:Cache domain-containing protein n=1 Tax=Paramecium tetraurelia TaxID=5888 RepID=A0DDC2_PARTE|nr:uncharacterized protein GSPATT00015898001 [Paramecium tetraurelia]CAK81039.1 unnamed protein product [Paramecium tetraurelia]|eukprot:XP_001448436.1 hypothetical protein (macronuclear) [Paramecium tetraurelia strain d4-2]